MADPGRLYSERELALILKQAAELQQGVGTPAARGELTLTEIQSIAAGAGIDPAFVAQAANNLPAPASPASSLLGAPARFQFSEIINGELTTPEMHEVVELLQHETEVQGQLTEVRDAVEWRARGIWGTTVVLITPRGGTTRIRLLLTRTDAMGVVYGLGIAIGIFAGFGVASVVYDVTNSGAVAIVTIAATLSTSVLAARAVWRRTARSLEQTGRRMLDRLVQASREIVAHSRRPAGSEAEPDRSQPG